MYVAGELTSHLRLRLHDGRGSRRCLCPGFAVPVSWFCCSVCAVGKFLPFVVWMFWILGPLFRVNPFVLDQYIDVWTRGPSDSIQSFVVEVTSIAYRSWVDWDRVGGCRENLFRAWVAFVNNRKIDKKLSCVLRQNIQTKKPGRRE